MTVHRTATLLGAFFATISVPSLSAQEAESTKDPSLCEFTEAWGDIENRSPTVMLVRQNQEHFDDEDTVLIGFFNDDWSIAKGDKLGEIKVANEDDAWFSGDAVAVDHGFVLVSTFKYASYVFDGAPAAMTITRNKKVVDRLRLSSIYSERTGFKSCRAKKVAARDEIARKRKLEKEIPKDPFAK